MMENFRTSPPVSINNSKVITIKDYKLQKETNMSDLSVKPIDLPKSDVLQFFTEDGSKITVRPSGTEPKIKFYFGIKTLMHDVADFEKTETECKDKIEKIKVDLAL